MYNHSIRSRYRVYTIQLISFHCLRNGDTYSTATMCST